MHDSTKDTDRMARQNAGLVISMRPEARRLLISVVQNVSAPIRACSEWSRPHVFRTASRPAARAVEKSAGLAVESPSLELGSPTPVQLPARGRPPASPALADIDGAALGMTEGLSGTSEDGEGASNFGTWVGLMLIIGPPDTMSIDAVVNGICGPAPRDEGGSVPVVTGRGGSVERGDMCFPRRGRCCRGGMREVEPYDTAPEQAARGAMRVQTCGRRLSPDPA